MIDAFLPLSILINQNASEQEVRNHLIQQQAISDLIDGELFADDYLQIIESTGVDIDDYANEILPIIETGIRKDLIWTPQPLSDDSRFTTR